MSDVGWELWSAGSRLLSLTDVGGEFWFETLSDGWSLGSPEAVKAVFSSLAADGDDERITRHGNRSVPFQVKVCGADLLSVAAGERALRLALNKAPSLELRYTPPDGLGEVTVFDVLLGEMPNQPDDLALVKSQPWSTYAVTLTCKPFVRAVNPVTTTLTYGSDTGTSLDDGSSTTNWSSSDGTLSAVTVNTETAVKLTTPVPVGAGSGKTLTRASLALTAAKPYIAVDVAVENAGTATGLVDDVSVTLNGVSIGSAVAAVPQSTGFVRYFFAHSAAGTTKSVAVTIYPSSLVGTTTGLFVGGIRAYGTAPGSGLMIANVEGSERAPMTVKLARTSASALGSFAIYSDPSMIEYGWNPGDPATWPNAPAGSYVLLYPIAGVAGSMYTVTLNGQTSRCMGGLSSAMYFDLQLGARRDGRIGTITGTPPANAMLFRDEPGVTSLIHIYNTPGRYLFIDSPTIETPTIGAWSGNASDGSDATSVISLAESLDALTVKPPKYALFIASVGGVGVTDLTSTLTYYPLSHTFVPPRGLVS